LAKALGTAGAGVLVTQVVPFPSDTSLPLVAAYQKALQAAVADTQPGFVSLEGYIVGRTVIAALDKIEGEPTRVGLLEKLSAGPYDIDGFSLSFGPNKNQGSDAVYLTIIDPDGKFKPVTTLS